MAGVKVVPVPALQDNYMYLVIDISTMKAGAVDPVDPEAMMALLAACFPVPCRWQRS